MATIHDIDDRPQLAVAPSVGPDEAGTRLFVVSVEMTADGERADLLGMASILHRRGVEVVEAELVRPVGGRRVFSATFRATAMRAVTVQRSMENLVDVVEASLFEAWDSRRAAG